MNNHLTLGRRLLLAFAGTILCLLAFSDRAAADTFQLVSPIASSARVERAIAYQVNSQVARHWSVTPVSFVSTGGIPVSVVLAAAESQTCPGDQACHLWSPLHGASILLTAGLPWRVETILLSHEIIETEVDETFSTTVNGLPAEVSDPVQNNRYQIAGVSVSDYVFPRWFATGSSKRWDRLGVTAQPGKPTAGGASPTSFAIAPAISRRAHAAADRKPGSGGWREGGAGSRARGRAAEPEPYARGGPSNASKRCDLPLACQRATSDDHFPAIDPRGLCAARALAG